jgi:nucleoside-diphosphate-sugar epimerase
MRADRSDRDAHFEAEQGNIRMAFNLYQVCLEEGVGRAVVLSSNHAADYLEDLVHENRLDVVTPDMRPLARGVYGWAKAAYEHLGFVFALGADGWPRLPNVQIRIGNVNETRYAGYGPDDQASMERALGAYLSARDQAQLAIRSLEAESLEDDDGVPFQIFYGISGNSHRFWSLANARRVVGYEPQDDSQILFADDVARVMRAVRDRDDG